MTLITCGAGLIMRIPYNGGMDLWRGHPGIVCMLEMFPVSSVRDENMDRM